jgi:hypothetical protein
MKVWKVTVKFQVEGVTEWHEKTALVLSTDDLNSAAELVRQKVLATPVEISVDGPSTMSVGTIQLPISKPEDRKVAEAFVIAINFVTDVDFLDTTALNASGDIEVVKSDESGSND